MISSPSKKCIDNAKENAKFTEMKKKENRNKKWTSTKQQQKHSSDLSPYMSVNCITLNANDTNIPIRKHRLRK